MHAKPLAIAVLIVLLVAGCAQPTPAELAASSSSSASSLAFGRSVQAELRSQGLAALSITETPTPVTTRAATVGNVLYEVEGTTDSTSITVQTPTGVQQKNNLAVPIGNPTTGERGFRIHASSGTFLYIAAQNERSYGSITCRITVDGVVIAQNTSSGGYVIATCQGTA